MIGVRNLINDGLSELGFYPADYEAAHDYASGAYWLNLAERDTSDRAGELAQLGHRISLAAGLPVGGFVVCARTSDGKLQADWIRSLPAGTRLVLGQNDALRVAPESMLTMPALAPIPGDLPTAPARVPAGASDCPF